MAKKLSKAKNIIASILCLILGLFGGFVFQNYNSLPDSYIIPEKVVKSTSSEVVGDINTDIVKESNLSIHFIELGNKYTGDCTLVKVGDTEMLIDAGSKESSIESIKKYLDEYVEDDILEYVIVTHAHEDHYAGFASKNEDGSIFDYFKVENIIEFAKTNKDATKGIHKRYENQKADAVTAYGTNVFTALECYNNERVDGIQTQRKFELASGSNIYCEILYQEYYEKEAESENDYSVCLQIINESNSNKYLFTGDLETDGESSLVDENPESLTGLYRLYKAGHHGSKTSSTSKLLEKINPEIVCVCCCAGSPEYTSKTENQFPTQEFINRVYLNNPNTKIYVTTLCVDYGNFDENKPTFISFNGNIVVLSHAELGNQVMCSNNGTELRDTDWFKENRTLPNFN